MIASWVFSKITHSDGLFQTFFLLLNEKIFSLCVDGLGPTQIAKWLQQNNVLNPTAYDVLYDQEHTFLDDRFLGILEDHPLGRVIPDLFLALE